MRTTLHPFQVVYKEFLDNALNVKSWLFSASTNLLYSFPIAYTPESSRSSMVWDLEAFSPEPTDDSFAALSSQTTVDTNYLNQGFLSY